MSHTKPILKKQDLFFILLLLLSIRLLLMVVVPLNDTTEARYAEIARKMLETRNWVTLWYDYGVPFWAKPPLSTWTIALSMKIFGIHAWAARLPGLLFSIGSLVIMLPLLQHRFQPTTRYLTQLVLASSALFFIAAGTVMTDPALLFCTTLGLTTFWLALHQPAQKRWGYLFFISLGLGLLAKGPLALVLIGVPIGGWTIVHNQWRRVWIHLPWVLGFLVMAVLALPWYVLAEVRTPGFLDYFIVGEHINRFLHSGWQGDLYGHAHAEPRGMIWGYMLAGFFPWSFILIIWLLHRRFRPQLVASDSQGWLLYVCLWALTPLLFFSFSGNIIYPYVLPALPGLALWLGEWWQRSQVWRSKTIWLSLAAVTVILSILIATAFIGWPQYTDRSQSKLMLAWQQQHPSKDSQLLYWSNSRYYSAEFYSQGRARRTTDIKQYYNLLTHHTRDFVLISLRDWQNWPLALKHNFEEIKRFTNADDPTPMILLRKREFP